MASPIYKDRVRENCTFSTVNNVALTGATVGFTTFDNGVTDYMIQTVDQTIWEVGEGTVAAGVLTRDIVHSNSLGTLAKIDFGVVSGIALQPLTALRANSLVQNSTVVEPDSFIDPLVPDLTLPKLKLLTVTSNFTLDEPVTGNGECRYYVTATGTGPYTITAGTGVAFIPIPPTIAVGSAYILNVTKFGATSTVAELTFVATDIIVTATEAAFTLTPINATITAI